MKNTASWIVVAVASLVDVDDDGLDLEFERILHEALALDKEVCRQVA